MTLLLADKNCQKTKDALVCLGHTYNDQSIIIDALQFDLDYVYAREELFSSDLTYRFFIDFWQQSRSYQAAIQELLALTVCQKDGSEVPEHLLCKVAVIRMAKGNHETAVGMFT